MIKKSITAMFGMSGAMILNYLFHMITTRILTVADYGDIAILISLITLINLPINGIVTTLGRKIAKLDKKGRKKEIFSLINYYFRRLLTPSILFTIILVLILATIGILSSSKLTTGIAIVSIAIPANLLLGIVRGFLQGKEDMLKIAMINTLAPLIKIIFTLLLVLKFNLGFYGTAFAIISGVLIVSAISSGMLFRKARRVEYENQFIDKGAIPIMITNGLIILMLYMDMYFVKLFLGSEGVGYYNVAGITSRLLYYSAGAIALALLPMASKLNFKEDKKEILILLGKGVGLLSIGLLAGLVLANWAITTFFTMKYVSAVEPFTILLFGMYSLAIVSLMFNIFWSQHMEIKSLKIATTALPIQLVLLGYFVPEKGIVGAAMATTITCLALLAMSSFEFVRTLQTEKS